MIEQLRAARSRYSDTVCMCATAGGTVLGGGAMCRGLGTVGESYVKCCMC